MSKYIEPTMEQFAEAAAWMAKMHGPGRTLQTERAFKRWLSARPEHGAAFESMTDGWEATGELEKEALPEINYWERAGYRHGFTRSVLAVAGVAFLAVGVLLYLQFSAGVGTEVGEQRLLSLEDGSRVYLNTATRVRVRYDENVRKIELQNGEALFEVAPKPGRPFIVEAGDRQIRALGTSFVVKEDKRSLAVTLVEGKVAVGEADRSVNSKQDEAVLSPGQRLTFKTGAASKLDRPKIDKVIAWRRGLTDFYDTPLAEAVEEMNRYTHQKLSIEDESLQGILVTGLFRTGDAEALADAVEKVYGVHIAKERTRIRISRHANAVNAN